MSGHNEEPTQEGQVIPAIKYVTWSAIVSIVPLILVGYQIQAAYVKWHVDFIDTWLKTNAPIYTRDQTDSRYAKRNEVITLAEANTLKSAISEAAIRASNNSAKLDIILLQSAEQTALAKEAKLDRINSSPESTHEWREQKREAQADFDRAVAYRDCIRRRGADDECDRMRGF